MSPLPETSPEPKKEGGSIRRLLSRVVTASVLTAFVLPITLVALIFAPGPLTGEKTIIIPRGKNAAEIGDLLAKEHAVYFPALFRGAARISGSLKAGEYAFPAGSTPFELAVLMHEGRSVARMFTVPEGLTSSEIVDLLNRDPVLTGSIGAPPLEGSLLPETYRYSYGDNRLDILARMQKAMREKLNDVWATRESGLPLSSIGDAVTLASLIEKETGKASERRRIAGVFYNRLRQKMRLQSDPTVIYAITRGTRPFNRPLTHEDLSFASPINTYVSDGLPPQPICNPGLAALEAAAHPERHSFFYFVADGTGGHLFAADLIGHNRNINVWRQAVGNAPPKP